MSEETDNPRKRGDAQWRSERDGIAARNDAARKAGKQERENNERRADAIRRAADKRERAEMGLNAGGGMLAPAVVLGGRMVGTWRRTLGRTEVAIAIHPFDRGLTKTNAGAIVVAAARYARFLDLKPSVAFH